MLLNLIEYHWAEQLDDALLLLGRLDVKTVPLAGGTYLLTLQDDSIQAVVDLRDLGLASISEDARGLHIGAMTTLQQLADAPLLKDYANGLLAKTALCSASSHAIRNSATIGGTLGAGSASQADLLTALVSLDASALLRSGSRTQVNLNGAGGDRPGLLSGSGTAGITYRGKQERRLACRDIGERRPSELITEILLPRADYSCGASFQRVAPSAAAVALINVAAFVQIENDTYTKVRLVCGGVNMEPVRVTGVEQQLEGKEVEEGGSGQVLLSALRTGMSEFRPPADSRVSSGYRRVCGMNLAYRALEEAIAIARWRAKMRSDSEESSSVSSQESLGRNL
jgi:CO/xanthine dehydrogenase FAD-binding subunit